MKIDQAVIGSCTNGRLADMRQAAAVLAGRTVHPDVRCIVIPATQKVYQQCIAEGLMGIFIDAHCAVSTPTCGPCLGGYMGILAAGERAIATTNRNFVGRMGDPHQRGVPLLAGPWPPLRPCSATSAFRKIWKPSRTRRSRRKLHEIQGNRAPLRARHRH